MTVENEQGAYEVTRHLIQLGHKRIGMMMRTPEHQFERVSTLVGREKGYIKAINEAGLNLVATQPISARVSDVKIFDRIYKIELPEKSCRKNDQAE